MGVVAIIAHLVEFKTGTPQIKKTTGAPTRLDHQTARNFRSAIRFGTNCRNRRNVGVCVGLRGACVSNRMDA